MPSRIKREKETIVKADDFLQENSADFASNAVATAKIAALKAKRNEIEAEEESKISSGGGARQNYGIARDADDALHDAMQDVANFAASMTDEIPALEEKFRMPRSSSRRNKIAVARSFAANAPEYKAAFIAQGLDADFIEDLVTRANTLEQVLAAAVSETAKRIGATNKQPLLVKDANKIIKSLDPIVRKVYRNDPAKLAAWNFASHVQRDEKPKPKPTV